MWKVPAGIKTCGMPSTEETRSFTNSAVGETSTVGVSVGTIVSTVAVADGMTVVGIVGREVTVDSITGTSVAVQALRMNRVMMMNFFMQAIICRCEPKATLAPEREAFSFTLAPDASAGECR
jgi:hypothetical protein